MNWDRPTEQYLAYLERLAQACLERDTDRLEQLLRLRLASHLPRPVLDELEFFRRARAGTNRAPLRILRHLHALRQLAASAPDANQLVLPLRAATRSARPASGAGRRRAARRR